MRSVRKQEYGEQITWILKGHCDFTLREMGYQWRCLNNDWPDITNAVTEWLWLVGSTRSKMGKGRNKGDHFGTYFSYQVRDDGNLDKGKSSMEVVRKDWILKILWLEEFLVDWIGSMTEREESSLRFFLDPNTWMDPMPMNWDEVCTQGGGD